MAETGPRYIGLDIHKKHITVSAVNQQQEVVLPPQKIATQEFSEWVQKHVSQEDVVALEASSNAWDIVDQLRPYAGEVKVAHSHKIKLIAASHQKTDKHDALVLARLLAARMLPEVWVPPVEVREARSLLAHRSRLVKARTQAKNHLHSLLARYNMVLPTGGAFSDENKGWWANLQVPALAQLQVQHELQQIEHLNRLLAETEEAMAAGVDDRAARRGECGRGRGEPGSGGVRGGAPRRRGAHARPVGHGSEGETYEEGVRSA